MFARRDGGGKGDQNSEKDLEAHTLQLDNK